MRKIILALTFAGTIIGAGFVSGKEIAVFFGNASILSIAIAAIALGGFEYVFVRLGSVFHGDVATALLGKKQYIAEYAVRATSFCTTAVMIAGGEYALHLLFGIRGGSLWTVMLVLPFAYGSAKGVGLLNSLLVPFAVGVTIYSAVKSRNAVPINGTLYLIKPLVYSAVSVQTAGTLVARLSDGLKRKDAVISSLIVVALTFMLILLIKTSIIGRESSEMPLVDLLTDLNLKPLGGALVYASILTTAISSLKLASGGSGTRPIICAAAALALSVFGFGNLIDFLYPAIGVIGTLYGLLAVYRLCRHKKASFLLSPLQESTYV